MIYEKVYLYPDRKDVFLETYCFERGVCTRSDAMLILPGGGYQFVSDREGEPIMRAFAAQGFNCFVLTYSICDKARFPQPLLDAAMAMKHIRENADRYNIDPEKICAVGFSAGGHLCGMLGNMWHLPVLKETIGVPSEVFRPTCVLLIYPVITAYEYAHLGSIQTIAGTQATRESLATVSVDPSVVSIEKNITEKSVPAFLLHTADDDVVPVENTLLAAHAYRKAGVPFEVHIYPFGPHGISIAKEETGPAEAAVAEWPRLACTFCRRFF